MFPVHNTTRITYSKNTQITHPRIYDAAGRNNPNTHIMSPSTVMIGIVQPIRRMVMGEIREIRPKVKKISGTVKTCAESVVVSSF